MGPWLISHGNYVSSLDGVHPSPLQWGRGLLATETCRKDVAALSQDGFNGAVAY